MRTHRTLLVVIGVLVLSVADAWAQKKDSDKAPPKEPAEFVEWVIKAHGGEAKLAKTNMMIRRLFCGIDWPEVGLIPFYLDVWIMPDKYRVIFQTPILDPRGAWSEAGLRWSKRESVLNGDKAWQSLNGQEKELTGSDLIAFKAQAYVENLCRLLPLRESRYELSMLDEIEFETKPLVGLSVSSKEHKPVNLYFDKKTGLLTKMQHAVIGTDTRYTNQDVIFREYRDTAGPKYWRRLTVITEGGKSFEAELVDVRFLDKLTEESFALPKGKPDKDKKP